MAVLYTTVKLSAPVPDTPHQQHSSDPSSIPHPQHCDLLADKPSTHTAQHQAPVSICLLAPVSVAAPPTFLLLQSAPGEPSRTPSQAVPAAQPTSSVLEATRLKTPPAEAPTRHAAPIWSHATQAPAHRPTAVSAAQKLLPDSNRTDAGGMFTG